MSIICDLFIPNVFFVIQFILLKILQALLVLRKEEWSSFRKFLLFQVREDSDLFELFSALQSAKAKLGDEDTLNKIKNKSFKTSSSKNFLNLQSKLYQQYEDWISYYDTYKDKFLHELQIIKGLNSRGLFDHATYNYQRVLKGLKSDKIIDLQAFDKIYRLQKAMYYSDNPIKQSTPELLLEYFHYNYSATYHEILLLQLEVHNFGRIKHLETEAELLLMDQLLQTMKPRHFLPIFELLKRVVLDLDESAFISCVNYLKTNTFDTESMNFKILVLYLWSKCGILMQQNKLVDPSHMVWIVNFCYETGAATSNNAIPFRRYINSLFSVCLSANKDEKLAFVKRWSPLVPSKNSFSIEKLSYGLICFYARDYIGIIEHLSTIEKLEIEYKNYVYLLLLIAYYKQRKEYHDVLYHHIINFKKFVKRNKNINRESFKKGMLNLIEIISDLFLKSIPKKDIDLSQYELVVYRNWVEEELKLVE